jgi:hypothetical protein
MSEIAQRHVIKCLYAKKLALDRIVAELTLFYGEQATAKKAVEYWIDQVKLGTSDMEDEAERDRPPLYDADARILACLSHEPFSSIRSIAQALGLAPATVDQQIPISLDIQFRHFRWILHVWARKLGDQRVKGARAPIDVLRQQEKTNFRDIITGHESWIFIDTTPSFIWLSLDEELPTRPRCTISVDDRLLIAFWASKILYTWTGCQRMCESTQSTSGMRY